MSITKDFSNDLWDERILGTGTVLVDATGDSVFISSPLGSSAIKRYYLYGYAGETITFTVQARNIPSGLAGFAGVFIDIPVGGLKNTQEVSSEDLQMYTVSAVVPATVVGYQKIAVGIGSYGGLDGGAEFISPVITRSGSGVIMTGFLQCPTTANDIPFLRQDYYNHGVGDIQWDATKKVLTVSPSDSYNFIENSSQFRPTLEVTGSADGNTTEAYFFCGSNTGSTALCNIQAVSLSTGLPVDLEAAISNTRFVKFTLLSTQTG